MMKEREKSALMEIPQAVGTVSHVDCERMVWNGDLEEFFKKDFQSL